MSSHNNSSSSSASDPRQPATAKPYVPPMIAPQDLPVDYSGFIAIVFGVAGVMFRFAIMGLVTNYLGASRPGPKS